MKQKFYKKSITVGQNISRQGKYFNTKKRQNKYHWTNHVLQKMAFYRLSESRIKMILRYPARVEEGIAPNTIACMQASRSKKRREEIWVMFQRKSQKQKSKNYNSKFKIDNSKIIIISAWRYPGVSPVGKKIEIPSDTLELLQKNFFK